MKLSNRTFSRTAAATVEPNSPEAVSTRPLALRLPEATRISGFSRSRLYRMAGTGEITFLKCGHAVLVEYNSLEAAIHRLPRATVKSAA